MKTSETQISKNDANRNVISIGQPVTSYLQPDPFLEDDEEDLDLVSDDNLDPIEEFDTDEDDDF